jgi:hypothetical protein
MTSALLLFIAVSVVLTAVTIFMVNQIKNAPVGFETSTGFHYGEPQQVAVTGPVAPVLAPVVSIHDEHSHAA